MVLSTLCVATLLVGVPTRAPVEAANVPVVQPCLAQPVLGPGSTGPGVLCLQFVLIMEGFSVPYDGVYGRSTEDAVRWYQSTHPPLVANGAAGAETLQALGIAGKAAVFVPAGALGTATAVSPIVAGAEGRSPITTRCLADATLRRGLRGQSVTCLQRRLIDLGYTGVGVSGVYDTATVDAVRAYQRATPPLTVDGVAGPRTLAALDIWSGMSSNHGRDMGPGPFPAGMQEEVEWRLTPQGIPAYGNRQACTPEQAAVIAGEFAVDGADALTQQWAVYVASREGGCRFDAVNLNLATKDDSHCTFQLNALSGMFGPTAVLGRRGWTPESVKFSLQACADAASDLWVFCGRGPWIPPYSCAPPWAGATVNQPPALLPPPPEEPPVSDPAAASPSDPVPGAGDPSTGTTVPVGESTTPATSAPTSTPTTTGP